MRNRLYVPLPLASARFRLVPNPADPLMPRRGYAQLRKHGAILFNMGWGITPSRIDTRYQHITPLCRDIGGIFGGSGRGRVRCAFRLRVLPFLRAFLNVRRETFP